MSTPAELTDMHDPWTHYCTRCWAVSFGIVTGRQCPSCRRRGLRNGLAPVKPLPPEPYRRRMVDASLAMEQDIMNRSTHLRALRAALREAEQ